MKKFLYKLFLLLFLILFLGTTSFADDREEEVIDVSAEIKSSSNFNGVPDVNSRSCVVIDRISNMILYGKNEKNKVKMASTTKIMTATIVLERGSLDKVVEVSKKAAGTGRF